VGPQVAGVEQPLAVGLDEQGARVGSGVVDGDRRQRDAAETQRLVLRQDAQVGGKPRVGEEDPPHFEDGDRPLAAVDGYGGMGVVREAPVVEVGVREHDGGDAGGGRVVWEDPRDVDEHSFGDQFFGRPLWRPPRKVTAIGGDQGHAEVEQDARPVLRADLDAHAAYLAAAAPDLVAHGRP